MPIAVNCLVVPKAMLGLVGETWIEDSVTRAEFTVNVDVPEVTPSVAVIVAEPAATEVASPMEPGALLTVATDGVNEFQVTEAVRSWLVPLE
jgi:hypothetical protein